MTIDLKSIWLGGKLVVVGVWVLDSSIRYRDHVSGIEIRFQIE